MVLVSLRPRPVPALLCVTGPMPSPGHPAARTGLSGCLLRSLMKWARSSALMKVAWERTVCPASMVSTHPARSRSRSSGWNSGTSLVLGPISRSAITTAASPVGGGGEQVRDHPVRPDRAADRLAVDREGREHDRPGDREGHRPGGPGPGHQVRPGVIGQSLGSEQREDPLRGVRVRRSAPGRAGPAVQRGEELRRGAADACVFWLLVPARRAGPKPERLRRWVNPSGIDDPGVQDVQSAAAADVPQLRTAAGQLPAAIRPQRSRTV